MRCGFWNQNAGAVKNDRLEAIRESEVVDLWKNLNVKMEWGFVLY